MRIEDCGLLTGSCVTHTVTGMLCRHGKGRLETADGDVYEGAWQAGCRHGAGERHVLTLQVISSSCLT